MTTTLTTKGQITLPKAVRDRLRLRAGDKVEFIIHENGTIELFPVTRPVTGLKGMVPRPDRARTLAEMEHAIKQQARGS